MKSDCCGAKMGSYSIPMEGTNIWQTKYYCKNCGELCTPTEEKPKED